MRKLCHMVSNQTPLTLPPEATVQHACALMRDRRAGSILVTYENNALIGIFTATDAVCRVLAPRKDPAKASWKVAGVKPKVTDLFIELTFSGD